MSESKKRKFTEEEIIAAMEDVTHKEIQRYGYTEAVLVRLGIR